MPVRRHKIYFYCPQKVTQHDDDDDDDDAAIMNCDQCAHLLFFVCARAERGSFKSFLNSRMKTDYLRTRKSLN